VVASSVWFITLSIPIGLAHADELHVFGPEGSPRERRVLVTLEPSSGGCRSWEGVTLDTLEDATIVEPQEDAGTCARWVLVRSERARAHVTLRAEGPSFSAASVLSLGGRERLRVRARRNGERLRVVVDGAAEGEELRVFAFSGAERIALEQSSPRTFTGDVAEDRPVGIVARSGRLAGATALPPSVPPDGAQVLILPTELAVEAGGPAREAAFLVVVDDRGRLSRGLPVEIRSERGRLRRMQWLERGVAVLSFSVALGADSIDLVVSLRDETLAEAELTTVAGWPTAGTLEVPAEVERGAMVPVRAAGSGVDGSDLPASALRIRCDGEALAELPAACPTDDAPDLLLVELVAMIDGLPVPLGSADVRVREPVAPVPIEPVTAPVAPSPRGRLLALIRSGFDTWGRFVGGVGGRIELPALADWFRFSAGVEYTLSPFSATGQASVDDELSAIRHQIGGALGGAIAFGEQLGAVVRGEVALCYGHVGASLRDTDASTDELAIEGRFAAGGRLRLSGVELGVDALLAAGSPVSSPTWSAAPVRVSLEVSVAALAP